MDDGNDFFGFMLLNEILFPDDEDRTVECPSCHYNIKGDTKVGWVNKSARIFKCPKCGEEITVR